MIKFEQKPTTNDQFRDNISLSHTISEPSGTLFTNKNSGGFIEFTLPAPTAGLRYSFFSTESGDIKVSGTMQDEDGVAQTQILLQETGAVTSFIASGTFWSVESRTVATAFGKREFEQQLSAGERHSSFSEANTPRANWGWGSNAQGQIGDGTTIASSSPVSVLGLFDFKAVSQGDAHTISLDKDGFAWSNGAGSSGQLGDNTIVDRLSPISVVGGLQFSYIEAGASHSVALDVNGFAWAWGSGGSGKLGDNTIVSKSSPTSVVGGHKFIKVAAAKGGQSGHSAAIDENGFAWSWGRGQSGDLGDNTIISKSSPVSVVGAHVFTEISAATHFTATLDSGGFAWCWGSNSNGNLGDNTTVSKSSPVSVVGAHVFTKISAGGDQPDGSTLFAAAIDNSGFAYCWGFNGEGNLGDGSTTDRSSPTSVVGGRQFSHIAAGENHVLALEQTTGIIWSWGWNNSGQLGDGATASQSSPVSVIRMFDT